MSTHAHKLCTLLLFEEDTRGVEEDFREKETENEFSIGVFINNIEKVEKKGLLFAFCYFHPEVLKFLIHIWKKNIRPVHLSHGLLIRFFFSYIFNFLFLSFVIVLFFEIISLCLLLLSLQRNAEKNEFSSNNTRNNYENDGKGTKDRYTGTEVKNKTGEKEKQFIKILNILLFLF